MKVSRAFASRRSSRRKSSESGYVLILVALSMVVLLGFIGLAIDVGYLEHVKRRMQTAADSAALAGAQELVRNGTGADLNSVIRPAALADAKSNGFEDTKNNITIVVNHPPEAGLYAGDYGAVEAIITQTEQPMFFIQALVGTNRGTVGARAVAHLGAGDGCMYILNDTDSGTTLTISGTSKMYLPDCAVQVNSPNDPAVKCNGTVDLNLDINVVGTGNCTQASSVSEHALPAPDPLADVPEPKPVPPCTYTDTVNIPSAAFPPDADGWVRLNQGVYCGGISISTGAQVVFNGSETPYYINNGGFKMTGGTVVGTGVTFYITGTTMSGPPALSYQPVTINGGNFGCAPAFCGGQDSPVTAPSGGPYQGILFFGDRTLYPAYTDPAYTNTIGGNANFNFNGIIYFKTGKLDLGGTGDMSASNTAIVADQAVIHGTPSFSGDLSAMPGGPRLTKAVLGE